jgi:hypothetical protein
MRWVASSLDDWRNIAVTLIDPAPDCERKRMIASHLRSDRISAETIQSCPRQQ